MSDDPFQRLLYAQEMRLNPEAEGYDGGASFREFLARAEAAARRSAARPTAVADLLSELGTELKIDDNRGLHLLTRDNVYRASVDIGGVLPAVDIFTWSFGDAGGDPQIPFKHLTLRKELRARTRSPALLDAFEKVLPFSLPQRPFRLQLKPETDRRTVLLVEVKVGGARNCDKALDLVEAATRMCQTLVEAGAVFAERPVDNRPAPERLEALLGRVAEAVSWVSGPVARVGDGVEARLALEEHPDAPSVLRFDLDGKGACRVYFEGRLLERTEKTTKLRPQEGLLNDVLARLFDTKVNDADFDAAWIIEGEEAVALLLASHAPLMARLRAREATVEVGPPGLVVRVPEFADEEAAVVDVAGAVLTLWRNLCRAARGFQE